MSVEVTLDVTCPLCGDDVDRIGVTVDGDRSYGCGACDITFVIKDGYDKNEPAS